MRRGMARSPSVLRSSREMLHEKALRDSSPFGCELDGLVFVNWIVDPSIIEKKVHQIPIQRFPYISMVVESQAQNSQRSLGQLLVVKVGRQLDRMNSVLAHIGRSMPHNG
jgi:hypothetical protein